MEVFVLPTNRVIRDAALSALKEIEVAKKRYNKKIPLVIVDNSKDDIIEENRSFVKDARKSSDVEIYHFDMEKQEDFIRKLSVESKLDFEELKSLLLPVGVDYGKIANMIFLISTMLGADTVIRRDSDCTVDNLSEDEYPIIEELKHLGGNIKDVDNLANKNLAKTFLNQEMLVVGSDYYGEWNLDVKEFVEIDKKLVKTLVALNDVDEKFIDDYMSIKYSSNIDRKAENPVLLSPFNTEFTESFTKADTYRYPECGNVAMKNVFQWFPSFIGQRGIGFDYNTQHLCTALKIPVLYHTNKVRHVYNKGRKDLNSLKGYWKGMIKQYDVSTLTEMFSNELENHLEVFEKPISEHVDEIAYKMVPDIYEKCFCNMDRQQRNQKIDTLINDVLLASNIEQYREIAEYLNDEREAILSELDKEYTLSIRIHRIWKDLIAAAKKIMV